MPLVFSGADEASKYNRPMYGLHGKYTLSQGVALPYFMASVPIDRAIDDLRIAEEVPPSMENRWSLRELYQREVNQERVGHDIVDGYLSDPKRLKFFNAITVVLMPRSAQGQVLDRFGEPDPSPPPIPWDGADADDRQWKHSDAKIVQFGGVQFVRIGDSARLRWAPESVHAVVVDGQHRIIALREFRDRVRAKVLSQAEKETRIPVIFLLLHEDAGFRTRADTNASSIRAVARELFTDLNKNAKPVDRARELILDDWSIASLCVRRLITNETAKDEPPLLPLTLVRWQEPINRFDSSYYLNSLVHLEVLVDEVLSLERPKNPLDRDEVTEFIDSIGDALGDEHKNLIAGKRSLREVYEAEYLDDQGNPQTPMSRLPVQFLDAAVEGFDRNHRGWLLRVLTSFRPYAKLLEYARANNLICGAFGQFNAQTARHRGLIQQLETATDQYWYQREILDPAKAIEVMKGAKEDADWAFKTIFQKALVRLARVISFEARENSALGSVDDLLEVMNALHERGKLKVGAPLPGFTYGLYTFIATNPTTGMIKVSRGVEERLFSLLSLWYFANRKLRVDTDDPACTSARRLVKHFSAETNAIRWPRCGKTIENLWKALDNRTLHGGDVSVIDPKQRDASVRSRLVAVLQEGVLVPFRLADGVSEDGDELGPELSA